MIPQNRSLSSEVTCRLFLHGFFSPFSANWDYPGWAVYSRYRLLDEYMAGIHKLLPLYPTLGEVRLLLTEILYLKIHGRTETQKLGNRLADDGTNIPSIDRIDNLSGDGSQDDLSFVKAISCSSYIEAGRVYRFTRLKFWNEVFFPNFLRTYRGIDIKLVPLGSLITDLDRPWNNFPPTHEVASRQRWAPPHISFGKYFRLDSDNAWRDLMVGRSVNESFSRAIGFELNHEHFHYLITGRQCFHNVSMSERRVGEPRRFVKMVGDRVAAIRVVKVSFSRSFSLEFPQYGREFWRVYWGPYKLPIISDSGPEEIDVAAEGVDASIYRGSDTV